MNLAKRTIFSMKILRELHTSIKKPVREISIPVPWGVIAIKWWGSTKIKPVLSLPGLQDNCGTFDRLIFLLKENMSFLAIDLPGHGYSTHLPTGMSYEMLPHSLLINRILKYFNWYNISIMGHSVGSMISYLFATIYPEKADYIVCMDAFKTVREPVTKELMRIWLDKYMKFAELAKKGLEPPSYTLEEINKKVSEDYHNTIELRNANYVSTRNISPSKLFPGKYYFSRDPMLKSPIILICQQTQEELIEDAKKFKNPIFIYKTAKHTYLEDEEKFYKVLNVVRKSSRDCEFHKVGGTHHIHLNQPEVVSPLINRFLEKHYKFEESGLDDYSAIFLNSTNR